MKHTIAITAAAFVAGLAFNASATVKPVEPDPQTQNQGQQQGQDQSAVGVGVGIGTGVGHGGAGGTGIGVGGDGQGGSAQGGQGGSASSYGALSNDIDFNNKMRAISFAAPAWTVIPSAAGCIVSGSTAWSAVFGLASYSGSKQMSDSICTMVNMAAAAQSACQYKTAAIINRRVFETMNPEMSGDFFELNAPDNLSPVACAELVRPRLIVDGRMPVVQPAQADNTVVSVTCATPQQPARRPASAPVRKARPARVCK